MPIGATRPAIPAVVQRRSDQIEKAAIKRANGKKLVTPEIDNIYNSFSNRLPSAGFDSVHINYSGGQVRARRGH